jgi:hypothetical protein
MRHTSCCNHVCATYSLWGYSGCKSTGCCSPAITLTSASMQSHASAHRVRCRQRPAVSPRSARMGLWGQSLAQSSCCRPRSVPSGEQEAAGLSAVAAAWPAAMCQPEGTLQGARAQPPGTSLVALPDLVAPVLGALQSGRWAARCWGCEAPCASHILGTSADVGPVAERWTDGPDVASCRSPSVQTQSQAACKVNHSAHGLLRLSRQTGRPRCGPGRDIQGVAHAIHPERPNAY